MAGRPKRRARIEAGLPAPLPNGRRAPFEPGNDVGQQFEPGNELAKTHGSYVSALRLAEDERTAELAAAIRETQPVSHPCDEGAIQRLALVYRRLERSKAALDELDAIIGRRHLAEYRDEGAWLGRLREDHRAWLREAGRIEAELARTPASRAKLGLHLASAKRALTLADLHEAAALELDAVEEHDGD